MRLALYYSSLDTPLDLPANQGFDLDQILRLLNSLRSKGVGYETIDSVAVTKEQISEAYLNAMVPSVYKKYRVRKVFGTRRRSGWLFGKGVPSLLVYEEGGKYPTEVFPREEQNGKMVTIRDYLENLLSSIDRSA